MRQVLNIWTQIIRHQAKAMSLPGVVTLDKTGFCCLLLDTKLLFALDTLYALDMVAEAGVPHYRRIIVPRFRDVACQCPACEPNDKVRIILDRLVAMVRFGHSTEPMLQIVLPECLQKMHMS